MPIAAAIAPIAGGLLGAIGSKVAGGQVSKANAAAASGVNSAVKSGQAGVTSAIGSGQQGVTDALNKNETNLNAAGGSAIGQVNAATGTANQGLKDLLTSQTNNLDPYLKAGEQGITGLQDLAKGPKFSFNYDDYKNSDAYKFQSQQGQNAIENSASARGLGSGGAALKDASTFQQGLASTYYDNAFNRAKQTFDTNQNSSLANLSTLIGAGQHATDQFNQVSTNAGNQIAGNTLGAGYYGANTTTGIAQMLAQMGLQGSEFNSQTGLQGNEFNADLGLKGASTAGQFGVGGGQANAAGTLGMFNNIGQGISGITGLFGPGGIFGPKVQAPGMDVGQLPGVGEPAPTSGPMAPGGAHINTDYGIQMPQSGLEQWGWPN